MVLDFLFEELEGLDEVAELVGFRLAGVVKYSKCIVNKANGKWCVTLQDLWINPGSVCVGPNSHEFDVGLTGHTQSSGNAACEYKEFRQKKEAPSGPLIHVANLNV